jgi:hypothetical protein
MRIDADPGRSSLGKLVGRLNWHGRLKTDRDPPPKAVRRLLVAIQFAHGRP